MTATKSVGRHGQGKQQSLGTKPAVVAKPIAPRPQGNSTKGAAPKPSIPPQRSTKGASSHGLSAPAGGATPTTTHTKAGASKTNPQPAQPRGKTHWTIEAASRVASATARNGDGEVRKGSFAADAMSRAMKDAHTSKGNK
jgi:hypothetical protein